MKTVLVGINSKYIHTCLALWYLKANMVGSPNVPVLKEFTINDNKDSILSAIIMEKPDILAFSCYIWNIEIVKHLIREIKKLLPSCIIILGGPEVSYSAEETIKENEAIDFVLCGEGEELFPTLITALSDSSKDIQSLKGIAYRDNGNIVYKKGFNIISNLDGLESPFSDDMLDSAQNRILYYESSRGCPFSCSYCISSTFDGVRYFSIERVRQDIDKLLSRNPKLIKFVDRTFNCNRKRAKEVISHIINLNCNTTFHFEAAADLFDEELLELLKSAPYGRIQLEIGLQTTNLKTLEEIDRITDLEKLKCNVEAIRKQGNIHVHLDLISGLPYEDMASFKKSFNEVYRLQPHQLQLGFLKMLKGSKIRREAEKHGYKFRDYSPYEVLENQYVSYHELLKLKDVEETLERYFNSGRFKKTLSMLEENYFGDAFEFFKVLSTYCREKGYLDRPVSYRENIAVLYEYVMTAMNGRVDSEAFRQHMVFDFLSSDSSGAIPEILKKESDLVPVNVIHDLLRNQDIIKEYLPGFAGIPAKNILKKVYFISLDQFVKTNELIMFDYSQKDKIYEVYPSKTVTLI